MSCTYKMNYAEIKKNDIANGEGVRTSLFVSGCRNRCKNCFNAVTWDFLYGKPFDQAVEDDIIASTRPRWISGLVPAWGRRPFETGKSSAAAGISSSVPHRLTGQDRVVLHRLYLRRIAGQKRRMPRLPPPIPGSCWD